MKKKIFVLLVGMSLLVGILSGCVEEKKEEEPKTNTAPTASFTSSVDHNTSTDGGTVTFDSTATDADGDDITYSWDFGDDSNSTEADPTHVYAANGTYTVILTVRDEQGMSDTDTCEIKVSNVDPTVTIESAHMDMELSLRVAGSKWSNVGLTLYEDEDAVGYLEVERWPGNPDDNPYYENPALPTTFNMTKN